MVNLKFGFRVGIFMKAKCKVTLRTVRESLNKGMETSKKEILIEVGCKEKANTYLLVLVNVMRETSMRTRDTA